MPNEVFKYQYFISYFYKEGFNWGFGNVDMALAYKLDSRENVNLATDLIRASHTFPNNNYAVTIVVLNFILLNQS